MEEQEEAGGFSLVSYEDEEEEEELPPQHTASSAAPTSTDGDGVDNPTDMGEAASHEAETGPSEMNLEATPSTDQLSTQNVPQQDHWTGIGSGDDDILAKLLPPRSKEPPSQSLIKKIRDYKRLVREGRTLTINHKLRHAKDFKNPYMLEWLVNHCDIDELGSNYPPHLFDPHGTLAEAFAEQPPPPPPADAGQPRAIEFTSTSTSASSSVSSVTGTKKPIVEIVIGTKKKPAAPDGEKRKSKWDMTEQPEPKEKKKKKSKSPAAKPTAAASSAAPSTSTATKSSAYAEYIQRRKQEEGA